jgi:hypothetical protein
LRSAASFGPESEKLESGVREFEAGLRTLLAGVNGASAGGSEQTPPRDASDDSV